MVVVVRDHHADLVHGAGPAQLAGGVAVGLVGAVFVQAIPKRQCPLADAVGLRQVHMETPLQLAHRGVALVVLALVAGGLDALFQVEDHALAQGALGRAQ